MQRAIANRQQLHYRRSSPGWYATGPSPPATKKRHPIDSGIVRTTGLRTQVSGVKVTIPSACDHRVRTSGRVTTSHSWNLDQQLLSVLIRPINIRSGGVSCSSGDLGRFNGRQPREGASSDPVSGASTHDIQMLHTARALSLRTSRDHCRADLLQVQEGNHQAVRLWQELRPHLTVL